jgi:hypothetical protein
MEILSWTLLLVMKTVLIAVLGFDQKYYWKNVNDYSLIGLLYMIFNPPLAFIMMLINESQFLGSSRACNCLKARAIFVSREVLEVAGELSTSGRGKHHALTLVKRENFGTRGNLSTCLRWQGSELSRVSELRNGKMVSTF